MGVAPTRHGGRTVRQILAVLLAGLLLVLLYQARAAAGTGIAVVCAAGAALGAGGSALISRARPADRRWLAAAIGGVLGAVIGYALAIGALAALLRGW